MNKLFKIAALACALTVGFTSCSKDDDVEDTTTPEYEAKVMVKDGETVDLATVSTTANTQGTLKRTGDVYSLRNFRQFTIGEDGAATTTAASTFFFDFKENDATDDEGPIGFANTLSSAIAVNVESGYSLYYIDKAFDEVTSTDTFIEVEGGSFGLNYSALGWLNYDRSTHVITPVADRTLVVFKDGKAYFKFRVNSVYSDETAASDYAPTNYFYYSIDYQEFK
ncbi:hypothetical protein [Sphingobacterium sp. LRF_L2]|uniref:hypothetical protein n=1 Tax=Sphingobacterium sp. LRF_L2 TaxID=3369421 RepID=UPI003F5E3B16